MYAQTFRKGELVARHAHTGLSSRHLEGKSRELGRSSGSHLLQSPSEASLGYMFWGWWGRRILLLKMVDCICWLKELILMRLAWATDCSSVWENHLCVYNYKYIVSLRAVHTDRFLLLLSFVCLFLLVWKARDLSLISWSACKKAKLCDTYMIRCWGGGDRWIPGTWCLATWWVQGQWEILFVLCGCVCTHAPKIKWKTASI